MKKFTFIFAFVAMAFGFSFGQATFIVTAPTNMTTTQLRAPNGFSSHAFLRASSLVLSGELSTIPVSTTLTSFGFTTTAGADTPVTGTMTVYLQNSGDATYLKGTTWSTIITGMTTAYTGTYTVPANATTIDLTLSTPFVYTGGSIYVAYDFVSTGPFAITTPCTYGANSSLVSGCVSASSTSLAPTTLGSTNFRPSFRWGYPNSLTNDVSVDFITGIGDVPALFATNLSYDAIIRNNSVGTLNNVPVTINISGANTYSAMVTVPSIAAGATTTVTVGSWTPLSSGVNTVNVSVPADQNNLNNSRNFMNTVSCNTGGFAQNPIALPNSVGFGAGSGILTCQVQLPVTATVTGAELGISTNTASVGNNIWAAMLDNTGLLLATSNTVNIANGDLGTIKSFTFATPVNVTAAQIWHIGMAQSVNTASYYPIAAYPTPLIPGNITYNTTALTGGTLTPLTVNLGVFHISADFMGSCIGLGVNNAITTKDNSLIVYPNPANTSVFVKLGSVNDKATAEVYNAIGQLVIPAKELNDNSAEITVSTLARGIYILRVTNGKEVTNTKIVIER